MMKNKVTDYDSDKKRLDESLGVYIHVPFCIKKCSYCAFHSVAGMISKEDEKKYVEDVNNQIESAGKNIDKSVDTIFIGGGTPTILSAHSITSILESVSKVFKISKRVEITCESNPETTTFDKLSDIRKSGVNRISIGCQSLDDGLLKSLGRIHDANRFYKAFSDIRKAGFENVSVDLMFALPGQTIDQWRNTVKSVVKLMPEHISAYRLQLEEGTPLYGRYKADEVKYIDESDASEMYSFVIDELMRNRYNHYEISNFALAGYECKHNIKYWSMRDYIGFGDGAASFVDGIRYTNSSGKNIKVRENTNFDNASEFVFTGLRKREGIRFDEFKAFCGRNFDEIFEEEMQELNALVSAGYVQMDDKGVALTRKGIDISNSIMSIFV